MVKELLYCRDGYLYCNFNLRKLKQYYMTYVSTKTRNIVVILENCFFSMNFIGNITNFIILNID